MLRAFKYHILCVGVNHSTTLQTTLRAAEKDAVDVSSSFRHYGYWDQAHNVCCVGPAASKVRVEKQLFNSRYLGELDLLLIYWSGHMGASSG
jgi:hypothetical protein